MITYNSSFIISTRKGLMGPDLLEDNMPVKEAIESDIKSHDGNGEQELKNGTTELLESPDKLLSSGGTTPEITDEGDEFDITLRFSADEDEDLEQIFDKECDMGIHPEVTVKDNGTMSKETSKATRSLINSALNDKSVNEVNFPSDPKVDQLNTDDESLSGKYLINDLSLAIQPCSSLGSKCGSKDQTDSSCCCAKKYSSMEKSLSAVLDDIDEVLNDCDPNQCNKKSTSQNSSVKPEAVLCVEKNDETDSGTIINADGKEQHEIKKTRDSDKINSDNGAKQNECIKSSCENKTEESDNVPKSVESKKSSDTCEKNNKNKVNRIKSNKNTDDSDTTVNNSIQEQSFQNEGIESPDDLEKTEEVYQIIEIEKTEKENESLDVNISTTEDQGNLPNEETVKNARKSDSSKQSHSSQDSELMEADKNDTLEKNGKQELKTNSGHDQVKCKKELPKDEVIKEKINQSKRSTQESEIEKNKESNSENPTKKIKNSNEIDKQELNDNKVKSKTQSEKSLDHRTKVSNSSKHTKSAKLINKSNSKKNDIANASKKTELNKLKSSENKEYNKKKKSSDISEKASGDSIEVDLKTDVQTNSSGKTVKKTSDNEKEIDASRSTLSESETTTTVDKDKCAKKRQLDEKQSSLSAKRLKNDDTSSKTGASSDNSNKSDNKKLKSTNKELKSALMLKLLPLLIENGEMNSEAVDVEEFVLAKIIEVISQRSELSELRDKINKHEAVCDQYRQKITHLTKQLNDMDVVVERLTQELKVQDRPVIPVKITRSVGLQVTLAVAPPRRLSTMPNSPIAKNDNTSSSRKKMTRTSVSQSPVVPIRPMQSKNPVNGIVKNTPNDNSNNLNNTAVLNKTHQVNKIVSNNSPRSSAASKNNSVSDKPVIDLTDEDDNKKSTAIKTVTSSTSITTNVSTTTTGNMLIPINSGSAIVVAPQQLAVLTGANGMQSNARVSYIMTPAPVVANGQKQMLIGQPQTVQSGTINKNILRPSANLLINRPPFNQKSLSQLVSYPTPIAPNNMNIQNGVRPAVRSPGTRLTTPVNTNPRIITASTHPAPPPIVMDQLHMRGWKQIPPRPSLRIKESDNGIQLSWSMPEMNVNVHEDIASYQIFAYQEQAGPPSTDLWRKVGDVKALPLPMACTLTSFQGGYQYYFAVRALDVHSRFSQFSYAQPISLDKLKS